MFTQKKKSFFKSKKFAILMVLVLSVFGYWVSAELDFKDKNDVQTGYNVSADKEETAGKASGDADAHRQSSENAYEKQSDKSKNIFQSAQKKDQIGDNREHQGDNLVFG